MDTLLSDLRFAIRALRSRPGFTALAVVTLAIGIGINAVAFTGFNALSYKPLRFADAEKLGWLTVEGTTYGHVSWPDYVEIAQQVTALDAIIAEGRRPLSLGDERGVVQIWSLCVSRNYLDTLRVRPVIGRLFVDADRTSTELAVVVSERFWNSRLGGTTLAGARVTLNGQSASVIGVLPDSFQGPGGLFEPDVWVLIDRIDLLGMRDRLTAKDQPWLALVGRRAPGITTPLVEADLKRVSAMRFSPRAAGARPQSLRFWPMPEGHPEGRGIAPVAFAALGIVGLVLLLACFNVASLLLARAVDRQRETSVRAALGASRARIVRQFALEGLMVAAAGGLAAIVAAAWSADLLAVFSLPSPIPQRLHLEVEPRVIAFIAALVAVGGVLPALLPAIHATRADLLRSMRLETPGGRRRSFARNAFIVAQVTGSTLFLAAALLLVRSFWHSSTTNPGFDPTHLVAMELKPSDYGYDAARAREFFDALLDRVRNNSAVEQAAIADRIPFYVGYPRSGRVSTHALDCARSDCRPTTVYAVGAGHFAALGVPVLAGRDFGERDISAGDAVIVSRSMAARLWPDRDAVGQWVRLDAGDRQLQVIGVAADITHHTFNERKADYLYRPLELRHYADSVTVIVRTHGNPAAFVAILRDQVRALDRSLPSDVVKTMVQRMELPLWPVRTAAGLFSICGALAIVLATVGLFGTTYLAVGQRTREFGIRAALGSTKSQIMTLVLREGLRLAGPGIVLGLVGAALVGRTASSALFAVDAGDASTYGAAAMLQLVAALTACFWPAHRATRADPILALRAE